MSPYLLSILIAREPLPPGLSGIQISNLRRSALKVLLSGDCVFHANDRCLWWTDALSGLTYAADRSALREYGLATAQQSMPSGRLTSVASRQDFSVRAALVGAGVLTVLFLVGQLIAWRQLTSMVLGDFSNPSVGFFFMITGVHGLHMVGGMFALTRAIKRAFGQTDVGHWRPAYPTALFTGTTCWVFGWWYLVCCSLATTLRFCSDLRIYLTGNRPCRQRHRHQIHLNGPGWTCLR